MYASVGLYIEYRHHDGALRLIVNHMASPSLVSCGLSNRYCQTDPLSRPRLVKVSVTWQRRLAAHLSRSSSRRCWPGPGAAEARCPLPRFATPSGGFRLGPWALVAMATRVCSHCTESRSQSAAGRHWARADDLRGAEWYRPQPTVSFRVGLGDNRFSGSEQCRYAARLGWGLRCLLLWCCHGWWSPNGTPAISGCRKISSNRWLRWIFCHQA